MRKYMEEILSCPIKTHEMTLRWDIEYWQSYVDAYLNNEISCPVNECEIELKKCKESLSKAIKLRQEFINNHAEYFI